MVFQTFFRPRIVKNLKFLYENRKNKNADQHASETAVSPRPAPESGSESQAEFESVRKRNKELEWEIRNLEFQLKKHRSNAEDLEHAH